MKPAKTSEQNKKNQSVQSSHRNRGISEKSSVASEEKNARRMESRIPTLAKTATKRAYRQALASGNKVLIAEAGKLKEVSPDGKMRVVGKVEPSVKMKKGQIIEIK